MDLSLKEYTLKDRNDTMTISGLNGNIFHEEWRLSAEKITLPRTQFLAARRRHCKLPHHNVGVSVNSGTPKTPQNDHF